jgi:chromosomal replication initiator protein
MTQGHDEISMTNQFLKLQWKFVCEQLSAQLGPDIIKSWIEPLYVSHMDNDAVVILVPTEFMKERIEGHYIVYIKTFWSTLNPQVKSILLKLGAPQDSRESVIKEDVVDDIEDSFDTTLDPKYTFRNFVVGKPNELAYTAALRVAESDQIHFNPLFLYGGVGLGKTHLMHAIAWKIRECHPQRRVVYVSSEKFMYLFIRALRHKEIMSFKEQFRTVDVLMIDDIQFIGGKDNTQEEFFHTFNALVDQNKQIIVSADKSPSNLENIEERLKSRLGWGLVTDIHPTTYELRLSILEAKADQLKMMIPKELKEFLAIKITSNIRELEGALNRIHAHTKFVGRPITLDSSQDLLKDLIRSNDIKSSIEDIQKKVCEFFGIKLSDMLSSKRSQNLAKPRHVAMYLCKMLTTKSLPEIGKRFSGRDHTTILHAVRKIEAMRNEDHEFSKDIDMLLRSLR